MTLHFSHNVSQVPYVACFIMKFALINKQVTLSINNSNVSAL